MTEQALSGSASRSEFETYVPPLIILAVILTLFQAAVAFTRELETGAARLMRLTSASTWEWLVGVGAALVLVSVAGQALTLAVAVALGFKAAGSILLALAPGALCSVAVTGVGLFVAAGSRTSAEALVYANLPLLPLMFLSGSVFPVPAVNVNLFGRSLNLLELVPSTPAVQVINRVLTLGETPGQVAGQLAWLAVLAGLTFWAGVAFFERCLRRVSA